MAGRPGSIWGERDYLRLLGGQGLSFVGSQFTLLALPLTAVLVLHAGPVTMGLLAALQRTPDLLFSMFAGAWLDRTRRRPAMVSADLLSMAALGSVPLAAVAHVLTVAQLFAVVFVAGTCDMVMFLAEYAYLPTLVPRTVLVDANRWLETARTAAALIGPGLAGLVVQAIGPPLAVAADAASFLVGAAGTASIRRPEPLPSAGGEAEPPVLMLTAGIRRLWGEPLVRGISLSLLANNGFWSLGLAVFVLLFVGGLGLTPAELGLVYTAASASAIAGGQLMRPVVARLGPGPVLLAAACAFSAGMLLRLPAAFAPRALVFPLLLVAAVVQGLGTVAYNTGQLSIRQAVVPNALRGRVEAALTLVVSVGAIAGGLLGGALGQAIGLRWTLVVACAGTALMVPPTITSGLARLRALPEAEAPG